MSVQESSTLYRGPLSGTLISQVWISNTVLNLILRSRQSPCQYLTHPNVVCYLFILSLFQGHVVRILPQQGLQSVLWKFFLPKIVYLMCCKTCAVSASSNTYLQTFFTTPDSQLLVIKSISSFLITIHVHEYCTGRFQGCPLNPVGLALYMHCS